MLLSSIDLLDYRNYNEVHIDFDPDVTIFYGDNAQGKTNILEAVYVCATTKSHRMAKDRDLIQLGKEEAHIKMILKEDDVSTRVDMHIKKNKNKGIAVNSIPLKKASDLFGHLNVVFFSPEDLNIIKNGPSERRKFVDCELCQMDKIYLNSLVNYNKILLQRNKLLKDMAFRPNDEVLLDIFDEQLYEYGCQLIKSRRKFIKDLNEIVSATHSNLSGGRESLIMMYEPDVTEDNFKEILKANRNREIKQKTTLTGPHRDDINFLIDEIDIRRFGSQGQQRTAALSLKLAEIKIVEQITKKKPILLLDDVLSELDSNRQNYLLNSIKGIQTLITCTGLDDFINNRFHIDLVYYVEKGVVKKKA